MTFSQILFGAGAAAGILLLGAAAPSGRVLVGTPTAEKASRDPSVRVGSAHGRHHWFIYGGGYHGGK